MTKYIEGFFGMIIGLVFFMMCLFVIGLLMSESEYKKLPDVCINYTTHEKMEIRDKIYLGSVESQDYECDDKFCYLHSFYVNNELVFAEKFEIQYERNIIQNNKPYLEVDNKPYLEVEPYVYTYNDTQCTAYSKARLVDYK